MNRWILLSIFTLQLSAWPLAAWADEKVVEDQVSFQVSVERKVGNDRAIASLSVTAENRDPAKLANTINESMAWALKIANSSQAIQSGSGSYQTFPVYDDKKIVRWRAQQVLQLESGDVDELSQMIGRLQERLQMQSLQFSVSSSKRREVEAQLIEEALNAFQARARLVSGSLGGTGYRLMEVNVHSGGGQRPTPMRVQSAALESYKVATPAFEQGTSTLTVQASGRIRLLRD